MKIVFDNGTPNPMSRSLAGHEVAFARKIGWHRLKNGDLIQKAEEAGYKLLLTTDKNIRISRTLEAAKLPFLCLVTSNGRRYDGT